MSAPERTYVPEPSEHLEEPPRNLGEDRWTPASIVASADAGGEELIIDLMGAIAYP